MNADRKKLLDEIIAADAADWNYPSPNRACKVAVLEGEYEIRFGEKAPAWPARGRW